MLIGLDIGGTKCAVCRGDFENGGFTIKDKRRFETPIGLDRAALLDRIASELENYVADGAEAIGISCGGPLDSAAGVILSPPNLPGWDEIPVTKYLSDRFKLPVAIQNDANACAMAEHEFGAGKGADNMLFLTFGTGLGAGIIINGKISRCDDWRAGGHID